VFANLSLTVSFLLRTILLAPSYLIDLSTIAASPSIPENNNLCVGEVNEKILFADGLKEY
jgi:hypothetical protein